MENIMRKISIFTIIVLILSFSYSTNIYGSSSWDIIDTKSTEIIGINEIQQDFNIANALTCHKITFQCDANKCFVSMNAITESKHNDDYTYVTTVYYYDSNLELIYKKSFNEIAKNKNNLWEFYTYLEELDGYRTSDICYYNVSVDIQINPLIKTTPSLEVKYKSYDYVIDKYDVSIVVNKDNTFDITESIVAKFKVPKHGIYRRIPLENNVIRLDGTTSVNHPKITNVSVNNNYTASKTNKRYELKIGSPDITSRGSQSYTIKYKYDLGNDPLENCDELYFNIIGNEWDTAIGNITFSISMPEKFDPSKLGFSSGLVGATDNEKIEYNINGNTIVGKYNGILDVGEGITVRCELPEGYFEVKEEFPFFYFMYIIPIIGLIITIILKLDSLHKEKVVETVEFYPPDNLNSLDAAFMYRGMARGKDVTSLLIYLANKGYIEIIDKGVEDNNRSSKFTIRKLKDYDGDNDNEKLFMMGLFKDGRIEVTDKMLSKDFYKTTKRILVDANSNANLELIFKKVPIWKLCVIVLLMIISFVAVISIPVMKYGQYFNSVVTVVSISVLMISTSIGLIIGRQIQNKLKLLTINTLMLLALPVLALIYNSAILFACFLMVGSIVSYRTQQLTTIWKKKHSIYDWINLVIVMCMTFLFLSSTTMVGECIMTDTVYLGGFVTGLICFLLMAALLNIGPRRTPYGNKILGKLKGFRNFLKMAEKEELEAMVAKDPTYFYKILPYTYVLDISDKWIKKFEKISLQAPSWYSSNSAFSAPKFKTFMKSNILPTGKERSSSPFRSGSSGGSSGGGRSGGGSGGGGGSSW